MGQPCCCVYLSLPGISVFVDLLQMDWLGLGKAEIGLTLWLLDLDFTTGIASFAARIFVVCMSNLTYITYNQSLLSALMKVVYNKRKII